MAKLQIEDPKKPIYALVVRSVGDGKFANKLVIPLTKQQEIELAWHRKDQER